MAGSISSGRGLQVLQTEGDLVLHRECAELGVRVLEDQPRLLRQQVDRRVLDHQPGHHHLPE